MSGSLLLDLLLLLLLVGYAGTGFRQGLFVGALSLLGFVVGAVGASRLLPAVVVDLPAGGTRSAVVLGGTLLAGVLLQTLLGALAGVVRSRVTWQPARAVDAATGLVGAVVATALVVWVVAGAVRVSPFPTLSRAVGDSRVVGAVDEVVPETVAGALDGWYREVSGEWFPRVFAGGAEPVLPVADPDAGSAQEPAVEAAAAGVVRVSGQAEACARGQEGTGFVVAPGRVLTNAHVVAGMSEPRVQVAGAGAYLPGTVVVFDAARDLAVVDVPGLQTAPLAVGSDLVRGDDVVVAGFPLNGPYALSPGRVRDVITAVGEDIYGEQPVTREVYSLNAQVRPGNSGGPVLGRDGRVVGVVFARSLDDASTGYAVTLAEAAPVLQAARQAGPAVDTGACAAA